MIKKNIKYFYLFFILLLPGCTNQMLDDYGLRNQTLYPPAHPLDVPPPPKSNGTIYQAGYDVALYPDHIARRVGDILTVRLEEATQGQKQAATKTTKDTTTNTNNGPTTNNPSIPTTNPNAQLLPVLFGNGFKQFIFETGTELDFDGKGLSNQSNRLNGTVSVTVICVLSNNNLVVQGESWVTINQGREYVRLTGIVRPEDIDAANTVSSQRVANARISYSGNGQELDATRGGLFTQLWYKFFPY